MKLIDLQWEPLTEEEQAAFHEWLNVSDNPSEEDEK